MKYFLLIIFSAFASTLFAQLPKPVSVANSYTLTDADGFPGYNYTTQAQFSSTGKIYIKDFFGNLHITGNNFIKRIPDLKNIENGARLRLQSDNELIIFNEKGNVSIIKNDSLYKTVEFLNDNSYHINILPFKIPYKLKPLGNYIEIYKFISDKWVLVNKAKWDTAIKINDIEPVFEKK